MASPSVPSLFSLEGNMSFISEPLAQLNDYARLARFLECQVNISAVGKGLE